MLTLWQGIVRRAFREPSIGSITTRSGARGLPKLTVPRSSEIAVNSCPRSWMRSSSAKIASSQRRSITRVRSPPSPIPSYSVRAAIPWWSEKIWRWTATAARNASIHSSSVGAVGPVGAMPWASTASRGVPGSVTDLMLEGSRW